MCVPRGLTDTRMQINAGLRSGALWISKGARAPVSTAAESSQVLWAKGQGDTRLSELALPGTGGTVGLATTVQVSPKNDGIE